MEVYNADGLIFSSSILFYKVCNQSEHVQGSYSQNNISVRIVRRVVIGISINVSLRRMVYFLISLPWISSDKLVDKVRLVVDNEKLKMLHNLICIYRNRKANHLYRQCGPLFVTNTLQGPIF